MKLIHLGCLAAFLLGLSTTANAGRIEGNSDYGVGPFTINSCNGCFVGPTLGATITGEDFVSTSNPDLVVFDFKVTNAPSNFVFQITDTSSAPINSANDLGLFTCDNNFSSNHPQCSNDIPPGAIASNYGSLSGNTASFPVTGAPSTDAFVFFVALNNATGGQTSVTASFATTGTPEPQTFPTVGLAIFAAFLLYRKRCLLQQSR